MTTTLSDLKRAPKNGRRDRKMIVELSKELEELSDTVQEWSKAYRRSRSSRKETPPQPRPPIGLGIQFPSLAKRSLIDSPRLASPKLVGFDDRLTFSIDIEVTSLAPLS